MFAHFQHLGSRDSRTPLRESRRRSLARRAPGARWTLGALALGLGALTLSPGTVHAMGGEDGRLDPTPAGSSMPFSGDPTVGTLPITTGTVTDVPGPDQVVYLHGEALAVRRALASANLQGFHGETALGVWALPDGRAWVELHGRFTIEWSELRYLQGIEVGIGAGFEGGGMLYQVQSAAGFSSPGYLDTGRSLQLPLERMTSSGLLARPVLLHGLHQNGARTRVEIEAPNGGLTIRQAL